MYECAICKTINHASRLHCSVCGSIPKMYSVIGKTAIRALNYWREVVVARGCERTNEHRASRVNLRTVPLDYYAE